MFLSERADVLYTLTPDRGRNVIPGFSKRKTLWEIRASKSPAEKVLQKSKHYTVTLAPQMTRCVCLCEKLVTSVMHRAKDLNLPPAARSR